MAASLVQAGQLVHRIRAGTALIRKGGEQIVDGGISSMDEGERIREGDVGLTFTCAVCCDIVYEWPADWLTIRISSKRSPAIQELFVHKRCLLGVIGDCVPLGEVFE